MVKNYYLIIILEIFSFLTIWSNQPSILYFKNDKIDLIEELKVQKDLENFIIFPYLSLKPKSFTYKQLLFYLNCNVDNPDLIKDESGKFLFLKKNVFLAKDPYFSQNVCYFKNREQFLLLETKKEEWPFKKNEVFSISFWFKPLVPLHSQTLVEWSSFTEAKIKKFQIVLNKEYIVLNLLSILKSEDKYLDLKVNLDHSKVLKNQWNHFFISFDLKSSNRILIFLNGKLIKLISFPGTLQWDFDSLHLSPVQIGGKFLGYINDFKILSEFYQKPITYNPYNEYNINIRSGRVDQSINYLDLPPIAIEKNAKLIKVLIDFEKPEGTILKIQYRFLDNLHKNNILWKNLSLENKSFIIEHSDLKNFIQFRIIMRQNVEGKVSPKIHQFVLEQEIIKDLPEVSEVKIIQELSNENQICLEWKKVPEEIIEEQGGYNIHIGIKNQEFEIVLNEIFSKGNWIKINKKNTDFPMTEKEKELEKIRPQYWKQYKQNHIRVILTKELLYQFAEKNLQENHLSINRIKLIFEENLIYYFSISTYLYSPQIHGKLSNYVYYEF